MPLFPRYKFYIFVFRLVLNLMTINIVSCLTLFPAIMLDLSLTADSKSTLSAVFPPSSPPTILPRKSQEVPIVNNGTIVSQNFQKKVLKPAFKKAKINVDISLLSKLGN